MTPCLVSQVRRACEFSSLHPPAERSRSGWSSPQESLANSPIPVGPHATALEGVGRTPTRGPWTQVTQQWLTDRSAQGRSRHARVSRSRRADVVRWRCGRTLLAAHQGPMPIGPVGLRLMTCTQHANAVPSTARMPRPTSTTPPIDTHDDLAVGLDVRAGAHDVSSGRRASGPQH